MFVVLSGAGQHETLSHRRIDSATALARAVEVDDLFETLE
jgi:hypothetical protein